MMIEQAFSFGGTDLTDYVSVLNVDRAVGASLDIDETEVPGMDGCLVSSARIEAFTVKVQCLMHASDPADVEADRRILAAVLAPGKSGRLVLPESCGLSFAAVCKGGAELSRLRQHPGVDLEFLVTDPVAYGARRTASVAGTGTVGNGGTAPACPVVTCVPATSPWRIANTATGEYVQVAGTFNGKKRLKLDMALERATVDGADVPVTVGSDFFALAGGAATGITVSSGSATLEWEERWY